MHFAYPDPVQKTQFEIRQLHTMIYILATWPFPCGVHILIYIHSLHKIHIAHVELPKPAIGKKAETDQNNSEKREPVWERGFFFRYTFVTFTRWLTATLPFMNRIFHKWKLAVIFCFFWFLFCARLIIQQPESSKKQNAKTWKCCKSHAVERRRWVQGMCIYIYNAVNEIIENFVGHCCCSCCFVYHTLSHFVVNFFFTLHFAVKITITMLVFLSHFSMLWFSHLLHIRLRCKWSRDC
jgi:hypothetical protein